MIYFLRFFFFRNTAASLPELGTEFAYKNPENENMDAVISKGYLKQVLAYPLLTAQEEADLAAKIAQGDKAAFTRLVNCNLRLVISLAKRCNSAAVSMMDLIQEGNLGLMNAAQKFSASFGTRFSTYAYPWIMQYMLRYIDSHASFIPVAGGRGRMLKRIHESQGYLYQRNGREATPAELSSFLELSEDKIRDCLNSDYSVSSLDVVVSGDGGTEVALGELIADTKYAPEDLLIDTETREEVRRMVSGLPRNEKMVIWYRFNLDGDKHRKTFRELARMIGMSPESVRQAEIRALKRLRNKASVEAPLAEAVAF